MDCDGPKRHNVEAGNCGQLMQRIVRNWQRFLRNDDGPTAVEYAVLLALILLICLAAIRSFGANTNALYNNINNSIGS